MEIKKLTPQLLEDYLRFFDTTPHDDEVDGHQCYCACWSSADSEGEDFSTASSRRALASRYIAQGALQGYLAYEAGAVVGWCNANTRANCTQSMAGRMYLAPFMDEQAKRENIKSVFCFVVAPEKRRQGVAARLLERVCEDAQEEGFDAVEAYPCTHFISPRCDYMGPAEMYRRLGFTVHQDWGDRLMMRKKLENRS